MAQNVILRLTFKPESAEDFLLEDQLANGQLVVERDDYTLEEAYDFVQEFHTSLDDAQFLIDGHKVVTLSDFLEEIE